VQSHDRSVEIFHLRTEEELRKKQARRKKHAKERKGKEEMGMELDDQDTKLNVVDFFTPRLVVRASGKIRSFDFGSESATHRSDTQVS
jgi:U3 small nucleolar RNA-associated protein 12